MSVEGLEPPTEWFVAIYSNPLSYTPSCSILKYFLGVLVSFRHCLCLFGGPINL